MNILAIGNSFSEDATRYIHEIARADGERLEVTNLYIPGCPLERHYRNMLSDQRAYELQYNGQRTGFSVSLSEALLNRKWDIVTLQQASRLSFDADSYQPYIHELAAYIRKCAPKARLFIHQTWAYEDGSTRLLEVAKYPSSEQMLSDVVKTYAGAAALIGADGIIPSGELLGALAKGGIFPIHRDGFHASYGVGRYALGLLWYRVLTGKPISENCFCSFDEPVSEEQIGAVKAAIEQLV